jgi:tetratricopeptide (TPR) repeat protein
VNKENSERFTILTELAFLLRQNKPDSSLFYGLMAVGLGKKLGLNGKLAATYNMIGIAHLYKGELSNAFKNYQEALNLSESVDDKIQMGHSHNNIARLFLRMGDIYDGEGGFRKSK